MPEWASVLVGVATGTVVTCVGVYYNEWLVIGALGGSRAPSSLPVCGCCWGTPTRRASPSGTMRERNQRHGQELWRRWYELREYFLEFGLLGSEDERELSKRAETDVALTIQALRNSVEDDVNDADRANMRQTAKRLRDQAGEALDRLENAL
jgi:hypothetical protein